MLTDWKAQGSLMEKIRLNSGLLSHGIEFYSPSDELQVRSTLGTGREPVGMGKSLESLVSFAATKGN